MAKLEEAWNKIISSDEYNNSDDAFKDRVRQRFFERTVGASQEFKSASYENQQNIQNRFFERIKPESGVSKALHTAEKVAETKIPGLSGFAEGMRSTDDEAVKGSKAKIAGRALAKGIEEAEPEVGRGGGPLKEAGSIALAGTMETGKKLIEGLVPETVGGAAAMAAVGPAEKGITALAPKIPLIGKALGTDVGAYGESLVAKFRGWLNPPGAEQPKLTVPVSNPLKGLIDDETRYENKLKEMSQLNDPFYKPFTPEFKTNFSQLRDKRQNDLINLRAEGHPLQPLAEQEEKTAYDKKLQEMQQPGVTEEPFTPEVKTNVSQLKDFRQQKLTQVQQEPSRLGLLKGKEQEATNQANAEANQIEEKTKYQEKLKSMPPVEREQPPIIQDPDVLKFGVSRNLADITQKPLRTILKEINDDIGQVGAIRFKFAGEPRAIGHDDIDVLNAAKDLRVAAKTPDGQMHVGNFGESHSDAFKDKIPEDVMNKSEFGFYDNLTKKFVSREEAATYLGRRVNTELMGQELGDLHRAGKTYLGKSEKGLHSEDIAKIKKTASLEIIKNINKELGERGEVFGEADPEKYDRIKQNIRELMRRAASIGIDNTEEIISFAARHGINKEELHFLQQEFDKTQKSEFDTQHISEVLHAKLGNKDMKNTFWEKVKDRWTPDGKASKVRTLLTKRYGEIAESHLDSQYFLHNTTKMLSKIEREALAFQGNAPREDAFNWPNAKEIIKLVKKPTENMRKANLALRKYMDEAHEFLAENFDDVGYIKDYVTLLWDKPRDVVADPKSNTLGTYNPFIQKRSFPDYSSGINAGNQPKSLDIHDIVTAYDRYKIKSVANKKFVDELTTMPTTSGLPAVMDAKRAPLGWVKAESVQALVGKRVHPDYLQAIKVITDAPFSNVALRAYDTLAETQRYASLTLSPFHFGSLFINSTFSSNIPGKIPLKMLAMNGKYILKEALADESDRSIAAKMLDSYRNGHAAFADLPLAKRATRAGLNLGVIGQEQLSGLQNFLLSTEAKLNKFYIGKGIRTIRSAMDILNKPLWDYTHAGIKMLTWQEHLIDGMKKFPEMPIQELERRVAKYVNDVDGGLAWEPLFVSPQYQKALHRLFFFPDWMVSRLRTVGTTFKVGTPEGYQAQKYWLRVATMYYTFANWRNYVNTKKYLGQGRFMWDNDPGNKIKVFSHSDENGRSIYNDYAPAITSVFKWFTDPVKSLGARFNPNLQLMTEFFTGSTLSGYKLPENQRDFASIVKRHYTPMMLGGQNEAGLFPQSKGMSSYEIVKRFEGVIKNGDDPSIVIKYGVENGYDIEKLYNVAKRNVTSRTKGELLRQ